MASLEFNGSGGEMYFIFILYYNTYPSQRNVGVMCLLSCLQFPFSQLLVWISFSENQLPLIWYSVLFHILLLTDWESLVNIFFFLNNFLTFSRMVSCSNAFVQLVIGSWVGLTPLLYVVCSKCAQITVMRANGFSLPFPYSNSGELEGFNSSVVSLRWATMTSLGDKYGSGTRKQSN